jgi:hypothetical protein
MRALVSGLLMGLTLAVSSNVLAAPAMDPRGEQSLARLLDGRTAGPPVNCIDPGRAYTTEIIDETAVVYRMPGGKLYVNRPRIGAPVLNHDAIILSRTFGMQLCDRDIVHMIDRGGRGPARAMGAVGLGPFVPYGKVER